MKKISMFFNKTTPSVDNTGFKYVLFEIADSAGNINHDWGFADWLGTEWGAIEVPAGYQAKVEWWANTVNPDLLLKEPSKIVRI